MTPAVVLYFSLLLLLACESNQDASAGLIVPRIEQEHFHLIPNGNHYQLNINLPQSERDEFVELKNSGNPDEYLVVKGNINTRYPNAETIVVYTADKNGYVAKYNYKRVEALVYSLSLSALKSAAG